MYIHSDPSSTIWGKTSIDRYAMSCLQAHQHYLFGCHHVLYPDPKYIYINVLFKLCDGNYVLSAGVFDCKFAFSLKRFCGLWKIYNFVLLFFFLFFWVWQIFLNSCKLYMRHFTGKICQANRKLNLILMKTTSILLVHMYCGYLILR